MDRKRLTDRTSKEMFENEYHLTGKYDKESKERMNEFFKAHYIPILTLESISKKFSNKQNAANSKVQIIIHRGTKEIGGSCVELRTVNTRILVDFGMPLVDDLGNNFDFNKYKSLSVDELIANKVLPDIEGLYKNSSSNIDAIVISHPHFDHFGLLNYIKKDIPVFLSLPTSDIIDINNIFTGSKVKINHSVHFFTNTTFEVGDFYITPYFNDHSSFISYSFLIEAFDKKVFYSGDFRSHGRKAKSFYWFLKNCPKDVDALLMEGTTIGRNNKKFINESDIEKGFVQLFKQPKKINLIYTSSQNIDRIVSIYRACKRTNKVMAIDFYTATVLKVLSAYASIPFPSSNFPEVRVYYPYFLSRRISNEGNVEILYQFKDYKITKGEIDENYDKIVMLVRPSVQKDLEKLIKLDNGNFIYSQWEGYRSRDSKTSEFIKYLTSKGMKDISLHTSGHADINTLKKYVNSMKPKCLIPIHTGNPSQYKNLFNVAVKCLKDRETYEI